MKVALIVIVADEAYTYIEEWLSYNKLLGFTSLYIYDNSSANIYNKYANDNVKVIHLPVSPPQPKSYQHFIENYKDFYDYVFFSDADEFLVLKKHKNISDFCNEYFRDQTTGAIAINWKMFGNNYHIERPQGPVLQNFTKCSATLNKHVKSIIRSAALLSIEGIHYPTLKNGFYFKNIKGNVLMAPTYYNHNNKNDDDVVQLNHYYTKSTEEFVDKCNVLFVVTGAPKRQNFFDSLRCLSVNEKEDKFALNFINLQHSLLYNKDINLLDISYSYNIFLKQCFHYDINIPTAIKYIATLNLPIVSSNFYLIPLRNPINRFIEMFYRVKYDDLLMSQKTGNQNIVTEFYNEFPTVKDFIKGIKQNKGIISKIFLDTNFAFFNSLSRAVPIDTIPYINKHNAHIFRDNYIEKDYLSFCSKTSIEYNESLLGKLNAFNRYKHADTYEEISADDTETLEHFFAKDVLIYKTLDNRLACNR